MATPIGAFDLEGEAQTLIITPLRDLRQMAFREIETGAGHILSLVSDGTINKVVLDFHKTDYFGSDALDFFVRLWKRVRERNGRMAFCAVSDHEREILKITRLDQLWPICASRKH